MTSASTVVIISPLSNIILVNTVVIIAVTIAVIQYSSEFSGLTSWL
jgi:hypothetical protein